MYFDPQNWWQGGARALLSQGKNTLSGVGTAGARAIPSWMAPWYSGPPLKRRRHSIQRSPGKAGDGTYACDSRLCVERLWLQMNPLLDFSGLPRFADIQPVHVTPPWTNCSLRTVR